MKDKVEIFWFSEQPYGHVGDTDLEQYESGRLGFPNTYFDPEKAHVLYNEYHEQYALADEVGFDGIMTNEHHASYWCMKPSVNLDAAVISKVTKNVKIAILGNVIAVNDPIRMAEEIAMLDCYSGGRVISGFVRGTAVETLQSGIAPTENRERFEEAHDLIIKCWTEPGPFRYEGKYYHYRAVNPWVLPMQKPHPEVWFPGLGSPESVVWAARHQHPYMNQGAELDTTAWLRQIYIDTAAEVGFKPGPEHFGYTIKVIVADTDEKAQDIGRTFLWTQDHRARGPREHNDPPGYQSREAVRVQQQRPQGAFGKRMSYEELQEISNIVVGNPDTVIGKLTRVIDRLNPGYLHIYGNEGAMSHTDVMRSIELLGQEVIPALHEIKLQPYE
jgi:alkanesulfonate monooxygenase SsuD/methylene tetrahydromethanopterin reductase-like flavin-dependent oxidoreductase (luciferase family)